MMNRSPSAMSNENNWALGVEIRPAKHQIPNKENPEGQLNGNPA